MISNDVIGISVEWGRGGEEVGDNEDKREVRRDFRKMEDMGKGESERWETMGKRGERGRRKGGTAMAAGVGGSANLLTAKGRNLRRNKGCSAEGETAATNREGGENDG